MEDKLNERQTQWKTNSIEHKWRITSMEDNLNGRQPQWKTFLNGRWHQWETTSMEDDNISLPSKPILFWAWHSSAPPCLVYLLYILPLFRINMDTYNSKHTIMEKKWYKCTLNYILVLLGGVSLGVTSHWSTNRWIDQ